MPENKTVAGFAVLRITSSEEYSELFREAMDHIFKLYNDGIVKPLIDTTWAFEDVSFVRGLKLTFEIIQFVDKHAR